MKSPATSSWLYDMYSVDGNRAYVHLPLVYASRLAAHHEVYAEALRIFPSIVGMSDFTVSITDGQVACFDISRYDRFRATCLRLIVQDVAAAQRLARAGAFNLSVLRARCLEAEEEFLDTGTVEKRPLSELRFRVARAIAVNLANPFVELALVSTSHCGDGGYSLPAPTFSYLSYFARRRAALSAIELDPVSDTAYFCWEVGFLGEPSGDGSPWEDPNSSAHLSRTAESMLPPNVLPPSIREPPGVPTIDAALVRACSEHNLILRCTAFLGFLQLHEELRHYWQLRVIRLLRRLGANETTSWASLTL